MCVAVRNMSACSDNRCIEHAAVWNKVLVERVAFELHRFTITDTQYSALREILRWDVTILSTYFPSANVLL